MSSEAAFDKKALIGVVADGALIGAGLFAVLMGISFGMEIAGWVPVMRAPAGLLERALFFISWLLQVATFALGPILTWYLVRGVLRKRDAIALLIGFALGGMILTPIFAIGPFLQWLVQRFSDSQYGGAIAYLVLVSAVLAAAVIWRLFDAVRDLAGAKERLPIDVVRVVAAIAVAAFVAVVVYLATTGEQSVEAAAFMLLAAYQTASVMAVAQFMQYYLNKSAEKGTPASVADEDAAPPQ